MYHDCDGEDDQAVLVKPGTDDKVVPPGEDFGQCLPRARTTITLKSEGHTVGQTE